MIHGRSHLPFQMLQCFAVASLWNLKVCFYSTWSFSHSLLETRLLPKLRLIVYIEKIQCCQNSIQIVDYQ